MSLPKVLIVDDHKVVAEGLVRLLSGHFEVVGTVNDGDLVLDSVLQHQPDVILLDASMPNVNGLEAMRRLKAHGITFRAILLTMHADPKLAVEALRAGAAGFMLKEASGDELLTAIDVVLRGDTYLATGLTKEIVTLMVGATDPQSCGADDAAARGAPVDCARSAREGNRRDAPDLDPRRRIHASTRSCSCSTSIRPRSSFATPSNIAS